MQAQSGQSTKSTLDAKIPAEALPDIKSPILDVGDVTAKAQLSARSRKKPQYKPDEARFIVAIVTAIGDSNTQGDVLKAAEILKSDSVPEVTQQIAKSYGDARQEYLKDKNLEREGHPEDLEDDPYHLARKALQEQLRGTSAAYQRYFSSYNPSASKGKKEMVIWIDDYNEMFDDFDPSPISRRAVSKDLTGRIEDKLDYKGHEPVVVRFQIAGEHWDQKTEELVKERLKSHYTEEEKRTKKELRQARAQGTVGLVLGSALLIGYETINHYFPDSLGPKAFGVILDLTGFVAGFYGAHKFIDDATGQGKRLAKISRLKKAEIHFEQY